MSPDEWTPAIGLRRAVISLAIRTVVITPLWATAMWLAAPARPWVTAGGVFGLFIAGLILAIPGVIIGHSLGRRLTEKAGMSSLLITAIACICAFTVVYGGDTLARTLQPFDDGGGWFIRFVVSLIASAWIARVTIADG